MTEPAQRGIKMIGKICPYMSHRNNPGYAQEVECLKERCAIFHKCQKPYYTFIDIGDKRLKRDSVGKKDK